MLDNGDNYLIKMRDDTLDFNKLYMSAFFNFSEQNLDPFLVQTSITEKQNLTQGNGVRALLKKKQEANPPQNSQTKIIIPLNDQIISKAKACQEMLTYEKIEIINIPQLFQ